MRPSFLLSLATIFLLTTFLNLAGCSVEDSKNTQNYDLYLLIGQSNMAGRGVVEDSDKIVHDRVFMFSKHGQWRPATDPLHFDKPKYVGVGPGLSFGKMIAAHDTGHIIGLIPAAVGGSAISAWRPGGYHEQTKTFPYDDAVSQARLAMKNGRLKGILWHQGESDTHADKLPYYQEALTNLAANLREDLDAPNLPFIVGGLGEFRDQKNPFSKALTTILKDAPNFIPRTGFVSAQGLTHKGDGVHFSAASARELGRRYANKFLELREGYGNYHLVWSDEFAQGSLPDPSKWTHRTGDGCPVLCGFGNHELQWYSDTNSKNARIENGKLIIEAHKETKSGKEYTSARLHTRYKGDWLYGRIEVRAKLPVGRGTWPAIWMKSSDNKYGTWPKSGEIDIMEHVGYAPDLISGTVHTDSFNHILGTQKGVHHLFPGSEDNFHIYSINWSPQNIEFLVDGDMFHTFENMGKGWKEYPFDQRFFLILNLAIGGNLGGKQGVDDTAFPMHMEVDFVRVYQKNN